MWRRHSIKHDVVLKRLVWWMATWSMQDHIRSDNGIEFTVKEGREWFSYWDKCTF